VAGSLFGLGLSQQQDSLGVPISGALLYIYAAGTSTPSVTYADFALSSVQTWPIAADSAGRIPQFWVADGSYRARLTTSAGVTVFDETSITAIGASSSGSGSASADTSTVFQTGDPIWVPVIGTRSGWVRANGRTISSGSGAGTERANGDTQALFEYLWNNFANGTCAVSGGRGADATTDYNANKTITTYTMRGRVAAGLDDMGNTAASVLVTGTPTAISTGGAEKQTIATANLPNDSLSHSLTVGTSITNGTVVNRSATTASDVPTTGAGFRVTGISSATLSLASNAVSGTVSLGGSGTTLATTPPYFLGTWYLKL
jgi:hypothetical protein